MIKYYECFGNKFTEIQEKIFVGLLIELDIILKFIETL